MKPVLMIHEVTEAMLSLPLENYTLTFDDGLYSQYYYWPHIKKLDTTKIFMVSGKYVSTIDSDRPKPPFNSCFVARDMANNEGIYRDYMNINEIKTIKMEGGIIGGHGYAHIKGYTNIFSQDIVKFRKDLEKMMLWFDLVGLDRPRHFTYPYNKEIPASKRLLDSMGIVHVYGRERTPIESLL